MRVMRDEMERMKKDIEFYLVSHPIHIPFVCCVDRFLKRSVFKRREEDDEDDDEEEG